MTVTVRSPRLVGLGLIGAFALTSCGGALASTPVPTPSATPTRSVQVGATFAAGSGTAITYDPALVPVGSRGAICSRPTDGGTTDELHHPVPEQHGEHGIRAPVDEHGDQEVETVVQQ